MNIFSKFLFLLYLYHSGIFLFYFPIFDWDKHVWHACSCCGNTILSISISGGSNFSLEFLHLSEEGFNWVESVHVLVKLQISLWRFHLQLRFKTSRRQRRVPLKRTTEKPSGVTFSTKAIGPLELKAVRNKRWSKRRPGNRVTVKIISLTDSIVKGSSVSAAASDFLLVPRAKCLAFCSFHETSHVHDFKGNSEYSRVLRSAKRLHFFFTFQRSKDRSLESFSLLITA